MTDLTIASIGERLKKAREARSLTIDQVQKETRIHSSVLVALEEGRCDKMLTPTYVKSFMKKYAGHLGLDAKEILEAYLAAHPEARSPEQAPASRQKEPPSNRPAVDAAAILRRAAPFAAAAIGIILLVVLTGKIFHAISGPGRTREVPAVKTAKAAPPKKAKAVVKTPPPKMAAAEREVPKKPEAPAPAKEALTRQEPTRAEPLSLVIRVKRGVFVSARSDGELLFNKHMPKGASETVKANTSINLYIGRGDSVDLMLNGKAVPQVPKGLVKDLEITKRGVRVK